MLFYIDNFYISDLPSKAIARIKEKHFLSFFEIDKQDLKQIVKYQDAFIFDKAQNEPMPILSTDNVMELALWKSSYKVVLRIEKTRDTRYKANLQIFKRFRMLENDSVGNFFYKTICLESYDFNFTTNVDYSNEVYFNCALCDLGRFIMKNVLKAYKKDRK